MLIIRSLVLRGLLCIPVSFAMLFLVTLLTNMEAGKNSIISFAAGVYGLLACYVCMGCWRVTYVWVVGVLRVNGLLACYVCMGCWCKRAYYPVVLDLLLVTRFHKGVLGCQHPHNFLYVCLPRSRADRVATDPERV